jgi:hypothetical protein
MVIRCITKSLRAIASFAAPRLDVGGPLHTHGSRRGPYFFAAPRLLRRRANVVTVTAIVAARIVLGGGRGAG